MKLKEIAARIDAHLQHFARDPNLSAGEHPLMRLYHPGAGASGNRVWICYVSYQKPVSLTKAEAIQYLAWIDAGNVGQHYQALREPTR